MMSMCCVRASPFMALARGGADEDMGEVIGMALEQTAASPTPTDTAAPQSGTPGGATARPQATAPAAAPQGDGLSPAFWVVLALLVLGFLALAGYLVMKNRDGTPPA